MAIPTQSALFTYVAVLAHRWNQILPNLLTTFEKLKDIGLPLDNPDTINNLPHQVGDKEEL
jgi:hypothetical protein